MMASSKSPRGRRLSQMFSFLVTSSEEPKQTASESSSPVVPEAEVVPSTPAAPETPPEPKASKTTQRLRRLSAAFPPLSIITESLESKQSKDDSSHTNPPKATPTSPRPATSAGAYSPRVSSLPEASRLKKSPSKASLTPPLPRGRQGGTLAPPSFIDVAPSRVVSMVGSSRPMSHLSDGNSLDEGKAKKRMSWLPGSRSRQSSADQVKSGPPAWLIAGTNTIEYPLAPLIEAEKVCDILIIRVFLWPFVRLDELFFGLLPPSSEAEIFMLFADAPEMRTGSLPIDSLAACTIAFHPAINNVPLRNLSHVWCDLIHNEEMLI
jgi:hypothetical protein